MSRATGSAAPGAAGRLVRAQAVRATVAPVRVGLGPAPRGGQLQYRRRASAPQRRVSRRRLCRSPPTGTPREPSGRTRARAAMNVPGKCRRPRRCPTSVRRRGPDGERRRHVQRRDRPGASRWRMLWGPGRARPPRTRSGSRGSTRRVFPGRLSPRVSAAQRSTALMALVETKTQTVAASCRRDGKSVSGTKRGRKGASDAFGSTRPPVLNVPSSSSFELTLMWSGWRAASGPCGTGVLVYRGCGSG